VQGELFVMTDTGVPIPVTLYGKPGCHLCEDAELLLSLLQRSYAMTVTKVDITADPALFERYKWDIPVVATPRGHVSGRIDAHGLRRLLDGAI
jgi:hypothetical protein